MTILTQSISRSNLTVVETQPDQYYSYGDLDGLLGYKPNREFWFNNPKYKQGYLDGVARRIDNQFYGLDMGKKL